MKLPIPLLLLAASLGLLAATGCEMHPPSQTADKDPQKAIDTAIKRREALRPEGQNPNPARFLPTPVSSKK